jgi:outer membrane protein OmpA-like peptidoglycan-associated protein
MVSFFLVNKIKNHTFRLSLNDAIMRFLLLTLLITSSIYSQEKFTVYFDTDKYILNQNQDSILGGFIQKKDIKINKVTGFCDFRASNAYNYQLGLNRANTILNALPVPNKSTVLVSSKGEEFNQKADLSLNRKVEIEYDYEEFETYSTKRVEIHEKPTEKELIIDEYPTELQKKIINSKVGDKILLNNLNFYVRTAEFYPESVPFLEDLYEVLEKNPNIKIEIQGHICCTPGRDVEEFSLRRCIAVYDFLVDYGISPDRMTYVGFDATEPLFPIPEKNEEERKANRRVEIMILEK